MTQANEDSSGKSQNVERLEKHLGQSLPTVLGGLLEETSQGEGFADVNDSGFRLMSVDEVIAEVDAFAGTMPLFGGVPFFTDGNGCYLFVHLAGPLAGRVSVLMEGYAYCVAFRSVSSLFERLDVVDFDDWDETLYGDYFTGCLQFDSQIEPTPQQIAADRQAVKQLRELWRQDRENPSYDEGHDEIYLANIITLTPWEDADSVRELLSGQHPDQFAIEWAGHAGERLIEDLTKLTETYQCGLAYRSLAKIGTARAKEVLLKHVPRCPSGHESSLAQALQSIDVPTRHEIAEKQKHVYLVQPPAVEDWLVVGTSDTVTRQTEQSIVIWRGKNRHEVEVSLALTSSAIQQLKQQIASSQEPEKAWVRWQFVSRLSSQYGQKVGFKVTKLLPPQVTRQESPYFRLGIDPETMQELNEVGRFGLSSSECTQFVFDYVLDASGTAEFVWLRD